MNNSAHAQYTATEIAITEAKAKLQALENKATEAADREEWDDFNTLELLAGKAERELQALQSKAAAIFREALQD